MSEAKEVFISYHESTAGDLAKQIADALELAGISVWYARRDLPPGEDFANVIPEPIAQCKVFLLLVNEGSNQSKHVENEVGLAFRRHNKGEDIRIMPIQVEECKLAGWLDYYFVHIQIKKVLNLTAEDIENLIKQVAVTLGHELLRAKTGYCGKGGNKNVRWVLEENGTLTISGQGEMDDYPNLDIPWRMERERIELVIIKHGVTSIGIKAFYGCVNLLTAIIPESIQAIKNEAFDYCTRLSAITIPFGVTSIGDSSFRYCTSLTSVIIPGSVTSIGDNAFRFCANLTRVLIPDSVASIGASCFGLCTSLASISIPFGVSVIREMTFLGCVNLANISIPDSVTNIREDAFLGCIKLTTVSIPHRAKVDSFSFQPTTIIDTRFIRKSIHGEEDNTILWSDFTLNIEPLSDSEYKATYNNTHILFSESSKRRYLVLSMNRGNGWAIPAMEMDKYTPNTGSISGYDLGFLYYCFDMNHPRYFDENKKYCLRIDRPAHLVKIRDGIWRLEEKGRISVE